MKRNIFILIFVLSWFAGQRVHAQCNVVAVADTLEACVGDTIFLSASGANSYNWSGEPSLSCTNCSSPYIILSETSSYAVVTGTSTVVQNAVNGNFSSGNTGFLTNYIYNPTSIWNEGTYAVGPNPNTVHPNFGTWGDHTTGSGNYMLVNGATSGTPILWRQVVNFPPGAVVTMKWWMLTFVTPPGSVQLKLFGTNVGAAASTPSSSGTWQQTSRTFTVPANNGTVTINMVTNSSALAGNDFGMDDISFTYTCTSRDTVWFQPKSEAQISIDSTSYFGCDSLCFELVNDIDTAGLLHYEWFLSDGTVDTSKTFRHCIKDTGDFTGYLITTSSEGCTDSVALPPIRVGMTRKLQGLEIFNQSTLGAVNTIVDSVVVLDAGLPIDITVLHGYGAGTGDSLYVEASNGSWSDQFAGVPSLVSSTNWSSITLNPEAMTICAYLFTAEGCADSICQEIAFYPTLVVPNFFTPNGDNINDILEIQCPNAEILEVRIYNRWGKLVFESSDPLAAWDGLINGNPAADGVYFIEAQASNAFSADREIVHRGTVHLMR